MEQRLLQYGEVRGWCFGAWGEVSTEVHHLVQRLAEARIALAETLLGERRPTRSRDAEKAGLVAYIRRSLSVTAVRAQAKFLLDRLRLLGDGAAEADRRRARAVQLEATAFRERRAQRVAFIQGRSIRRLGFGRLDLD